MYAPCVRSNICETKLAERLAAARKPLNDLGIYELLGHGAGQRAHTSEPKAKNTVGRTCRSRDTISSHVSDHEEAYGGWRRMG